LYYKIETTVTPIVDGAELTSFKETLCIVVDSNYDPEGYDKLLGNGFYVHGRAGIFDEIDYEDDDPDNQIKPTK
jgi:hypothetical protein